MSKPTYEELENRVEKLIDALIDSAYDMRYFHENRHQVKLDYSISEIEKVINECKL